MQLGIKQINEIATHWKITNTQVKNCEKKDFKKKNEDKSNEVIAFYSEFK